MQPENINQPESAVKQKSVLHQVTPLSKYLAMVLFIVMPFIGGYIGYTLASEKVLEVERVVVTETQKQIKQETLIETPDLLFLAEIPVDVIVDPENFAYPGCRLFGGNDSKIKNWLEPDKSKLNDIIDFYVQASLISDLVELDYNKFNKNVVGRENNEIWITACTCEEYEKIQQLVNKYGLVLNGTFGHTNLGSLPLQDCPNVPKLTGGYGE